MKIKAKNLKSASTKLIVPFDGLIDVNVNGIAEVSEKCGSILLEQSSDWELVEEGGKNKTTNSKKGAEADKTADDTSAVDETAQIIAGLKAMTLEDSIELAKESGYPESEWKKFAAKQNLMAAYLVKKFKDTQN